MILLLYLSAALLGIGVAGVISSRNIIITIFSIELMLLSSIIMLAYGMEYKQGAAGAEMILAIWAVAALDVIVLVALYLILKPAGSFEIKRFSELKG
ncbi:MAG: NADH-quinone oxidoreductase subunit NuoK [Candidatus Micrarchaeia archaeon]